MLMFFMLRKVDVFERQIEIVGAVVGQLGSAIRRKHMLTRRTDTADR